MFRNIYHGDSKFCIYVFKIQHKHALVIYFLQVLREDFIRDIVEKKREILIPVTVYFCEETERALFMDVSANGRPVCQATGM